MLPTIRRRLPLLMPVWIMPAWITLAMIWLAPGNVLAGGCLTGTLADEFTADRMGLVREWIIQIPSMAPGQKLENVASGDGLVVATTSDSLVHAIQATPSRAEAVGAGGPLPGTLLWSRAIGRAGGRVEPAGIGPDLIAVSQDKDIHGLERATGLPRWQETDKNLSASGAAVIGDWVYAPNGSGMTRFAVNPLRQPADAQAVSPTAEAKTPAKKGKTKKKRVESLLPSDIETGGTVAYQPVTLHDGVLWCTTDGLLVTLQASDADWLRLEFALENPPAGPPTVRDKSIFAATTNGDLARIDLPARMTKLAQLQLTWHAVLPGPAASSGFVAGDTVVVSLGDLGIAAYSAETGAPLWQSCVSGEIVSVGGDRVWLFDRVGRLSSLHLADGLRRETLCLGPFTLPLVNLRDDRLLLASPSGMIVSLVPRHAATEPAAKDDEQPGDAKESATDAGTDSDAEPTPAAEPAEEMADPDANQ